MGLLETKRIITLITCCIFTSALTIVGCLLFYNSVGSHYSAREQIISETSAERKNGEIIYAITTDSVIYSEIGNIDLALGREIEDRVKGLYTDFARSGKGDNLVTITVKFADEDYLRQHLIDKPNDMKIRVVNSQAQSLAEFVIVLQQHLLEENKLV